MDEVLQTTLPTNLGLCRIAGDGQLDELKLAVSRGTPLIDQDLHGNTGRQLSHNLCFIATFALFSALFHAAWAGQIPVLEYLLARMRTTEVNIQNRDGNTALHFAVARKHVTAMEKLIQFGADIYIKNKDKESPQDFVKTSKELKQNNFVMRLFVLAGSKFIGVRLTGLLFFLAFTIRRCRINF